MTDTRRVKDVRPKTALSIAEFDGDAELMAMGFIGETSTYKARLNRIRLLAREGKGPGAFLERFLADCGYKAGAALRARAQQEA